MSNNLRKPLAAALASALFLTACQPAEQEAAAPAAAPVEEVRARALDFSSLIEDETYVFAFAFGAIPFKGATGSPVRPFAIR